MSMDFRTAEAGDKTGLRHLPSRQHDYLKEAVENSMQKRYPLFR
jgi:hypothetical protein